MPCNACSTPGHCGLDCDHIAVKEAAESAQSVPLMLHCGGGDDTWDPAVYAVALGERCPMSGWKFQRAGEVE